MVYRYVFLGGHLECVSARHDTSQFIGAIVDRPGDRPGHRCRVTELLAQADHLCLALLDVGHQLPAPGCLRRQIQRHVDQISPADAMLVDFLRQRHTAAEAAELVRGEQHFPSFQAKTKYSRGLEGLARLGPVGNPGIECK